MDQHHHITTHHHKSPHHTYCSWVQHKQQKQQKQHQQHQQHVKLATVVATVDQQLAHTAYACTDRLPSSQIGSMGSMGSMVAHGSTFLQLQHVLAAHCSTCDMQLRSERIQPDNTRTHTLDQVPLSSVPCKGTGGQIAEHCSGRLYVLLFKSTPGLKINPTPPPRHRTPHMAFAM
jgi:hypothetical protein